MGAGKHFQDDIPSARPRTFCNTGNVVPTADNLVRFTVQGAGGIIAVSNGNSRDHDSFQASQRKAYNGLRLAILQSTQEPPGSIRFVARSDGLRQDTVEIETYRPAQPLAVLP